MNLRERLLKAGVKPRDLRQAVQSARELTEQTQAYSALAETVLSRIARHPRVGKKTRAIFVVAAKVAGVASMAASDMLAKRGRK